MKREAGLSRRAAAFILDERAIEPGQVVTGAQHAHLDDDAQDIDGEKAAIQAANCGPRSETIVSGSP